MQTEALGPPPRWTQAEFVDALGDGMYGVDPQGCCIFVNAAALRMLGYANESELLGRNMHDAIHHTRPDGAPFPQSECPLLHTATSGLPVRLENEMLWRHDGTPFFAEYSSYPVRVNGAVTGCIITFSDLSVRQDAQRRLAVQYAVSQILTRDGEADGLAAQLLQAIGAGLGWEVGVFWQRQEVLDGHDILRRIADWRADRSDSAGDPQRAGAAFELAEGSSLPGQTWAHMRPIHVTDLTADTTDPRMGDAIRLGLRCGLAFPLIYNGRLVGAAEFYSRRPIALDDSLLEALSSLGQQIGQTLQRWRTASALAESERLKRAILALSPDGVVTIDKQGCIVEFNEAAERIFGRDFAAVLGHELGQTIFPPETQEMHRRAFQRAQEGDGSVIGRRVEVDAVRADGTRFPIELSITRTASGVRPLFTAHLRDISARRTEQARIRQSEARFRTIANAIPQLSWMTDPDGAVVWYNERWYAYTGSTFESMAGWRWKSVHHPDHVERVERRLREAFANGTEWEDTFPLRGTDGTYRWFLSRALAIREEPDEAHPTGRLLGWFGTNTDVTAMREAEAAMMHARDEAEAANVAKSTFIANMSHELRTPLSAIIGYAEMLGEEIADGLEPSDLARDVQKIEGNARHLLGLINDVLDLSKVESGKMEAYAETFDVAKMAEDVASTVDALMARKSNRFALRLQYGLGTMHSDITRLRQVLLNLLSNAAKFTENGDISLSIRRETLPTGDRMHFAVTDTGIGMTPEQLEKLFQRFQQADASTTRQFGGTGLGLALTRGFAALLGGEVAVQSTPGEGTTFTVSVPAQLSEPPETGLEGLSDMTIPPGDVVLVVDDDPTQRELVSRFLLREGFVAQTAADGPTGLAMARRLRPRAILLDVTMPGMDGWSVLSALKADPELAEIPVVMVTFVAERALASALGAADYILKPVDWERLHQVMESFRTPESDVLLVEDDPDTRERMRHALERNGWRVIEAGNGEEGLAALRRAVPAVILLDLNMPVMDGFAFLHALRQREDCADVPVVVLTAMDLSAEDRRRLRGANQILNKGDTGLAELAEKLRGIEIGAGCQVEPQTSPAQTG